MFSIDFLHDIRSMELDIYIKSFPSKGRILEIGGGTGAQAKIFNDLGYDIESIDVAESNYADELVYDVKQYDGKTIPFPDESFDIVFSSNVLEHIAHIDEFHHEMKRVLTPDGVCIHIMPTGVWTFWTSVTHYLNIFEQLGRRVAEQRAEDYQVTVTEGDATVPSNLLMRRLRLLPGAAKAGVKVLLHTLRYNRVRILPPRHGEYGTVFTELYTFSRFCWKRHFRKNNYEIIEARPMGLFYTGYMLFGARWPLNSRRRWAPFLGSACVLYKVRPK